MEILITGGTGFIGFNLQKYLLKKGHRLTIFSRSLNKQISPNLKYTNKLVPADYQTIINLAGENIGKGLWTKAKKKKIYDSRLNITNQIVELVKKSTTKPQKIISASAIGYYANLDSEIITEDNGHGDNFLSKVCQDWEESIMTLNNKTTIVNTIRIGLVLGNGGILKEIKPIFRMGLGAILGSGKEWISWISMIDLIRSIDFLINNPINGPINLTAPNPCTSEVFYKAVAKAMKRPLFFKIPKLIIKLALGEKGTLLMLSSQKVLPKKLSQAKYSFQHKDIQSALDSIL